MLSCGVFEYFELVGIGVNVLFVVLGCDFEFILELVGDVVKGG